MLIKIDTPKTEYEKLYDQILSVTGHDSARFVKVPETLELTVYQYYYILNLMNDNDIFFINNPTIVLI